jgi:RNA polymerase sigma factor for flagellar operon FliA
MGMSGLAKAVDRFDPSRGASFVTFAYHKIRGAILDGLRRSDRQYSFQMRCRLAAERRATEQLAFDEDFLSGPSQGDTERTTDNIASSMSHVATLHLASVSGGGDEHAVVDPDVVVHQREIRERVAEAIARLPEKERQVIRLCYFADGSLADVAAQLGMSRAWASRLHKRALSALRTALAGLGEDAPNSVAMLTEVPLETVSASGRQVTERPSVPRLELHLVRPSAGQVGTPSLQPRHRCEQLNLSSQLLAAPIATVRQDHVQTARLSENVCESSLPLAVEGAAGGDVARLLAPMPRLVGDSVDRPLDEGRARAVSP